MLTFNPDELSSRVATLNAFESWKPLAPNVNPAMLLLVSLVTIFLLQIFVFIDFLPRFSAECANFLSSAIHRVAAILMCWLFQIRFKGIFFNIFFFSIDPLFIFRDLRFRLSLYLHWQFCRKINQVYVIVHHITFTWHATCHIVFISNSMRCQPVLRSMWVQIVCGVESCLMWIICSDIVNISIWCCSRWIVVFTWGNSEPAMNCPCTLYKPFTTMWLCTIIYMWL